MRCIFVRHLPYHKKWKICVKLSEQFCEKYFILPIKFNYAAPFSPLKPVQSWFHTLASLFGPLATFLLDFYAFVVCLTFLSFVREAFLILWHVKSGSCFATVFYCCLLIPYSVFWSVPHCQSRHPHYCHDQSHCLHLKILQVGRFLLPLFLLPLSPLKYFLSQT